MHKIRALLPKCDSPKFSSTSEGLFAGIVCPDELLHSALADNHSDPGDRRGRGRRVLE
jgi:hypothetical protein